MGSLFSKPKAPEPTAAQKKAEAASLAESERLDKEVAARKAATARKRRGRASLISGEETGIKSTLG